MATQLEKSQREFRQNILAGTLTGMTTICLTSPFDTLRCRWQVLSAADSQPLLRIARSIIAQEGLWAGLWRPGLPPNIVAMGVAVGGRNGFYPSVRDGLGWCESLVRGRDDGKKVGATGMFVGGLLSGMLSYFVASPLLQVKTQMQAEAGQVGPQGLYLSGAKTGQAPTYNGAVHALRTIMSDGAASGGAIGAVRGLWRGSGIIVGRGAVLSASQLMAYDKTKTVLREHVGEGPVLHCVASQVAAAFCTTCSMPLDVVLTVYQSAHSLGGDRKLRYGSRGPIACAATMLKESGPRVFMRGWVPGFLRLSPTCTFSFWLYEQLRVLAGLGYLD